MMSAGNIKLVASLVVILALLGLSQCRGVTKFLAPDEGLSIKAYSGKGPWSRKLVEADDFVRPKASGVGTGGHFDSWNSNPELYQWNVRVSPTSHINLVPEKFRVAVRPPDRGYIEIFPLTLCDLDQYENSGQKYVAMFFVPPPTADAWGVATARTLVSYDLGTVNPPNDAFIPRPWQEYQVDFTKETPPIQEPRAHYNHLYLLVVRDRSGDNMTEAYVLGIEGQSQPLESQ